MNYKQSSVILSVLNVFGAIVKKKAIIPHTLNVVENVVRMIELVGYSKITIYSVTKCWTGSLFLDNLLLPTSDLFPVHCTTQFQSFLIIIASIRYLIFISY